MATAKKAAPKKAAKKAAPKKAAAKKAAPKKAAKKAAPKKAAKKAAPKKAAKKAAPKKAAKKAAPKNLRKLLRKSKQTFCLRRIIKRVPVLSPGFFLSLQHATTRNCRSTEPTIQTNGYSWRELL
ncbi:MAG: hypothetical protein MUE72_03985 [Chitinophagaceae bacterium]|nr:hypothetical protein [Chitinophagaceae bacterium]